MGTEHFLLHKKTNELIEIGRSHTFGNSYVEEKCMREYLRNNGLPAFIIIDLCKELIQLKNVDNSFYHHILEKLEPYDKDDISIEITQNDDRFVFNHEITI